MNRKERQEKLKTNKRLYWWWWALVLLSSIVIIPLLYTTILVMSIIGGALEGPAPALGHGLLILFFAVLWLIIPLTIYGIEKWIMWLLWLKLVVFILSSISKPEHILGLLVSAFSVYAYREILKYVYDSTPTTTSTITPSTTTITEQK